MTKGSKLGKTAKRDQLAQARAQRELQASTEDSLEGILERVQEELTEVKERLQTEIEKSEKLSQALHLEKVHSTQLSSALDAERDFSAQLSSALDGEREHSKQLYMAARVERRARQRGQQRKVMLEKKIKALNAADLWRYEELKKVTSKASKTIDTLVKLEQENSSLQSELLKTLERCVAETVQSQQKIKEVVGKLQESKKVAKILQRQCGQAKITKERAVQKAKDKMHKESSVYRLLHKGTYSEDTRNLIRLLVQAGCSREHVSKVIHAVFKVAGISVKGDISRRTVSRVILEGYYAAQVQLGYEMEKADGML